MRVGDTLKFTRRNFARDTLIVETIEVTMVFGDGRLLQARVIDVKETVAEELITRDPGS